MENQADIDGLILRTRQYEFVDGLRDVQMGLIFLLMGVVWFGIMLDPSWLGFIIFLSVNVGAWAKWAAFVLVLILPALAAFGMRRLMRFLRERWLWRQSGMVQSSRRVVSRSTSIASVVVFILTLTGGFLLQTSLKAGQFYIWSLIFLAAGWSFGVVLIWFGIQIKISRYIFIGLMGGLVSTMVLLFQSSLGAPALIFTLGWGVILLTVGLINLIRAWPSLKEGIYAG